MREAGITRRPLYRYSGDYRVVLGGPWMADPYHHDRHFMEETAADVAPDDLPTIQSRLQAIFRIAGGKPGLVFWIGDATLTPEAFHSHLRKLNKVLIPKTQGAAEQAGDLAKAADIGEGTPPPDYELVIFRHADANVMAQVLPALDKPQSARLLGPCREVLFVPDEEWGGNIRRLSHPGQDIKPPAGPLRWEPDTMRAISERRMEGQYIKIAAYLRKVAPDQTRDLTDKDLLPHVKHSAVEARQFGIKSEAAHCRWAYLHLLSHGQVSTDSAIRTFMTSKEVPLSPDERVRELMQATIERLKGSD